MVPVASPALLSTATSTMKVPKHNSRGSRTFTPLVLFNDFASSTTASSYNEVTKPLTAGEVTVMDSGRAGEDVVMNDDNDINTVFKHASNRYTHQAARPPSPSSSPSPLAEHRVVNKGVSQPIEIISPGGPAVAGTVTPPSSYTSTNSSMDALAQRLALAPASDQQRIKMQRKKIQHMLDQNSLLWWELVRYTRMVERNQRERDLDLEEREGERRRRRVVTEAERRSSESQQLAQAGLSHYSSPQDRRPPSPVTVSSSSRRMEVSTAHSSAEASIPRQGRSPRSSSPIPVARPQPVYPVYESHAYPATAKPYGSCRSSHAEPESDHCYLEEQRLGTDRSIHHCDSVHCRGGSEECAPHKDHSCSNGNQASNFRHTMPVQNDTDRYLSSRPHAEDTVAAPRPRYYPAAACNEYPSVCQSSYASPCGDDPAPTFKRDVRIPDNFSSSHPQSRDGSEGDRSLSHSPRIRYQPSPSPSLHSGSRASLVDHSLHYRPQEHHLHRQQQPYRPIQEPQQNHQQQEHQQIQGQQGQGNRKRRGNLPKSVTTVLKAWLVENAKHPYPTEDEKLKLSQETGLTLNQISNWFINARRRILQPILVEAAAAAVAGTDEPMDQVTIVRKGKGSRMLVEVEGGHHQQLHNNKSRELQQHEKAPSADEGQVMA
ncbi:hypothetical protein BGW42_004508 [Actinomortierella wolfii]|nr:hypothetical protein BGW42_004508 [Actinomortierella wolfii]